MRSLLITRKLVLASEDHILNEDLRDPVGIDLSKGCTSIDTLRSLQ